MKTPGLGNVLAEPLLGGDVVTGQVMGILCAVVDLETVPAY